MAAGTTSSTVILTKHTTLTGATKQGHIAASALSKSHRASHRESQVEDGAPDGKAQAGAQEAPQHMRRTRPARSSSAPHTLGGVLRFWKVLAKQS